MIRINFQRVVSALASMLFLFASFSTMAESSAHDVVRGVTVKMEKVLGDYRSGAIADQVAFEAAVGEIFNPVVSYAYIARNIMGKNTYKSASAAQREAFTKTFQKDLMGTYARALVSFGEITIKVVPPEEDVSGKRRISVTQEVTTEKDTYKIAYTMGLSRKSQTWKLINVVLNGANLGNTFAGQFKTAMSKHNNDLDVVISSWGDNDKKAEPKGEPAVAATPDVAAQ